MTSQTVGQFGDGPLSRAAARIHTLLVVELLLLATALPALVGLVGLGTDPSNLPLLVVCLTPVGPAVCAALYALHHQRLDLTDLHPARLFLRGYRVNVVAALRVWVPTLLWVAVVAVNLTHLDAAAVPGWWVVPSVLVGVAVTVVGVTALTVTALFDFRTRDVLRLALYFLVRTPSVPVGTLLLAAAGAGVVAVFSEAVLALFGVLFVWAQLRIGEPMTTRLTREFVA
ncbi:hypothetical protein [Micromonospora sp. SH-82]|uniref:hypothetical protein n=1 Tax=Micromonospora sp. SH-82 TaxID=3132938 RepID=UPI003EBA9A47